jgi:hypothetical protein
MTRKDTRSTGVLRGIAPLIAVLSVLIALAALGQTRGAGQASGKSNVAPLSAGASPMDSPPPLFAPAVAYDSGGFYAFSVAVGDVNRDGKPDLVVANYCGDVTSPCTTRTPSTVGVLLGNGDGTFRAAAAYDAGGAGAWSVAVADLNGDDKLDILVTNEWSGTVGVLLGNGDGTFHLPVTYSSGGGYFPRSVVVADVNRDGRPDLLVANADGSAACGCGTVGVLLGNGDGTFQPAVLYGTGSNAQGVAVSDVNGDGNLDLVVANDPCGDYYKCSTQGSVGVLLGKGDGTFQAAVTYGSGANRARSVAVADVNGDGKPDLMVANHGEDNGYGAVGVLLGKGDGTFQAAVAYDSGGVAFIYGDSVTVADFDGDGKPDLAVTNFEYNTVAVLLGNGAGAFQAAVPFGGGGVYTGSVAVADLNGDGRPDLVVANAYASTNGGAPGSVGVLLNNSGPQTTSTSLVSSANPAPVHKTITYTATVSGQYGGAATGTMTFQDGGATIATVPLASNQAAYSIAYGKGGSHAITATYSGDARNAGSTSGTLTEYISSVASKTVVTTSGSPSFVGQPVTFTATVTSTTGTIPDGELVTFYDGTTTLGSVALAGGTAAFTTSALSAKTHTVKATYIGDATFKPSTGFVTQVVNKYTTTTTLTSSPNPSQFGQAVTFTAHVTGTGPAPTGKVKFLDGTTSIGSAALSGGVAKLTKSTLAVGTHPITAEYLSDAFSAKSTSAVVNQAVQ